LLKSVVSDSQTTEPSPAGKRSVKLADGSTKKYAGTMRTALKIGRKLSFKSTLENWAEGMDYCAIAVPAKITEALGTKSAVLVMARINDSAPFKVSLFPVGGGKHYIRVRKKVRKDANLKEGDGVLVLITPLDRSDIKIPVDLRAALRGSKASARFDALTAGKKNYMIRRIDDASKPETRAKRVREAVEEICRTKKGPTKERGTPKKRGISPGR
jgi:translation initiation factor IF-1